jgi:hypothetical protein
MIQVSKDVENCRMYVCSKRYEHCAVTCFAAEEPDGAQHTPAASCTTCQANLFIGKRRNRTQGALRRLPARQQMLPATRDSHLQIKDQAGILSLSDLEHVCVLRLYRVAPCPFMPQSTCRHLEDGPRRTHDAGAASCKTQGASASCQTSPRIKSRILESGSRGLAARAVHVGST